MKKSFTYRWLAPVAALALGFMAVSCDDEPDKFELTDGTPVVKYVRTVDPATKDSLLTGAYLDNQICLVGDNLTSIHEIYFNDQKAIINTALVTDHTMLVTVPGTIPEKVSNKIFMHNTAGVVTEYDFKVLVPAPSVRSISCEWAKPGELATIYGDYFIDEESVPLQVFFAGNIEVPRENIKSIAKNAITFTVPDNWTEGYMTVTSIYGSSRSGYKFHDTTNILFDWDGTRGGLAIANGWRTGKVHNPGEDEGIDAIDGSYLYMDGPTLDGEASASWAEDNFSFNFWPDASGANGPLSQRPEFAQLIEKHGIDGLQIKFEVLVPSASPWMTCAMQMIFTSYATVNSGAGTNSYIADSAQPRGLWTPWIATGSYDTAGKWVTVSQPLSGFNFTHEGGKCGRSISTSDLDGLTFFVYHGGVNGTTCDPVICVDNIRVVPIE